MIVVHADRIEFTDATEDREQETESVSVQGCSSGEESEEAAESVSDSEVVDSETEQEAS